MHNLKKIYFIKKTHKKPHKKTKEINNHLWWGNKCATYALIWNPKLGCLFGLVFCYIFMQRKWSTEKKMNRYLSYWYPCLNLANDLQIIIADIKYFLQGRKRSFYTKPSDHYYAMVGKPLATDKKNLRIESVTNLKKS